MKSTILILSFLFITQISFSQNKSTAEAIKTHLKNAKDYESANLKKEAAEEWQEAWELDRQKIDFAHNAVRLYIDRTDYQSAMEILNAPELAQDRKAKDLINKLNATPEMKLLIKYNEAMKLADFHMSTESLEQAKLAYEKALDIRRNDTEATVKLQHIKEEMAWKKALDSGYLSDMEQYVIGYPNGKYIAKANEILRVNYLRLSKNYYAQDNETQLEDMYESFTKHFPRDPDKQIEHFLTEIYIRHADSLYKIKNWESAANHYERYLKILPKGPKASFSSSRIKKIEQLQKRIVNQTSSGFLIYTYNEISPIGLSFGHLDNKGAGLGYYINIKMNKHIFKEFNGLENTDTDELANLHLPDSYNGESEKGNVAMSGGLTFKIIYPLWGYGGVGLGYNAQYEKVYFHFTDESKTPDHEWMRNKDFEKIDFFPEGGLLVKPGKTFVLKYGIMYNKKAIHQFGIGFQL